jgi:hypothetical protein
MGQLRRYSGNGIRRYRLWRRPRAVRTVTVALAVFDGSATLVDAGSGHSNRRAGCYHGHGEKTRGRDCSRGRCPTDRLIRCVGHGRSKLLRSTGRNCNGVGETATETVFGA